MSALPIPGQMAGIPYGRMGASSDPRYAGRLAMAQALMRGGSDTSPIQSPWQGVARMGQALLGGHMANKVTEDVQEREKSYGQTLAQALAAGQGAPSGLDPKTGITWDTARPGGAQQMGQVLAGNPDTAGLGFQMAMQQQQMQQQAQQQLATEEAKRKLALQYDPQLEAAKKKATLPIDLEAKRGEYALRGEFEPQIAGATEEAKSPALVARAGAVAEAELPAKQQLAASTAQAQAGGKEFERANTLRDEFNSLTKDFRTVQDAYSKIKKAAPTGAGDMSLLYSYVKLLDPGSVVRESEFATAAASGSYGERIQGLVQRALTGQRLPDTLRADFMREADSIYQGQKRGYDTAKSTYTDISGKYGIPADRVIVDYATSNDPANAAPAAANAAPASPAGPAISEGATATNPQTGQKVVFKGGQWVPM